MNVRLIFEEAQPWKKSYKGLTRPGFWAGFLLPFWAVCWRSLAGFSSLPYRYSLGIFAVPGAFLSLWAGVKEKYLTLVQLAQRSSQSNGLDHGRV